MADVALKSIPAFAALNFRRPAGGQPAGATATERVGLGIATLAARPNRAEELAEVLRAAYDVELRPGPKVSRSPQASFVGIGPGNWLASSENGDWRFARDLAGIVRGCGSVCDQSSGYGVLRLSGPRIRETLAKGVPVDLHPAVFEPGDAAVTLASHVGVVLWQVDDAPTYDVAVFRSYAASFAHWLTASAAEFGGIFGTTA